MRNLYENLPESPGVYFFKDSAGKILYIGKAASLKRRVSSYFSRANNYRIEKLISKIKKIGYRKTESVIEALILESTLIKKYKPPFNIREKDDKSFLYVEITNDRFPRVLLVRGKSRVKGQRFGPFTSASNIREALRIIRKIFPFNVHPPEQIGNFYRPCFDYELGLCPGACIGSVDRTEYTRTLRELSLFFRGKKQQVIRALERRMKEVSKNMDFEKAAKIRGQIFALKHIQDVAFISEESEMRNLKLETGNFRVEGYDISNISGTSAVGAMVVFKGGKPDKSEYRKFKIRTFKAQNDVGMIKEVLRRRFANNWPLPNLILVDGGKAQVNAAKSIIEEAGLIIPIVGLAKGPQRKKNEFFGNIPDWTTKENLIKVRDEVHRFAISYHRDLRNRTALN